MQGYARGLFSHPAQRPVIEVKNPKSGLFNLKSRPIWHKGIHTKLDNIMLKLEQNSDVLLREAMGLLNPNTLTHHISSSFKDKNNISNSHFISNILHWVSTFIGLSSFSSGNMVGFAQSNALLLQSKSSMFSFVW